MTEKKIYLRYLGTGAAIINVPARDLTFEEFEKAQAAGHDLLTSGLYELAEPEKQESNTEYPAPETETTPWRNEKSKKRGK